MKPLSRIQMVLLLGIAIVLLISALFLTLAITNPQKSPDQIYRESHLPAPYR